MLGLYRNKKPTKTGTRYYETGLTDSNGVALPDRLIENYDPNSNSFSYVGRDNTFEDNTNFTNIRLKAKPKAKSRKVYFRDSA